MTNNQASFAADMVLLQSLGLLPVVVHGGGPQINKMLEKLEIQSTFVNGLRVTTPAVMEVVEMVLCGQLNKQIASAINAAGGRAVGISGKDDALVTGSIKNPELGLVGEAEHVKTSLLHTLLEEGIIPVIAPVATGEGGTSGGCARWQEAAYSNADDGRRAAALCRRHRHRWNDPED